MRKVEESDRLKTLMKKDSQKVQKKKKNPRIDKCNG